MTPSGSEAPKERPSARKVRPKGPPPISDGLTAYKGFGPTLSFSQENATPKGL